DAKAESCFAAMRNLPVMHGSQEWVYFIAPTLASLPQRAAPFLWPWMAGMPKLQEQISAASRRQA
ncbi:MAG: hypothetical protein ABIO49_10075, partial [Dokdonella sp.]